MSDQNEKELKELLKHSVPPWTDTELRRDLWPQMLQKLSHPPFHVPWFDWALAAILAALLLLFPGTIPALLYHL
jgi:hypothetical protein